MGIETWLRCADDQGLRITCLSKAIVIDQDSGNSSQRTESDLQQRSITLQRLLILGWDAGGREEIARVAGESGFDATMCSTPEQARQLLDATEFQGLVFDSALYGENSEDFVAWLESAVALALYRASS